MKKYLQSSWMRVLSTILCAIFVVNLSIGIFGFALVTEYRDIDSLREEGHDIISMNYGLYAIDMLEQGKVEQLEKEFSEMQINCSIKFVTNNPGENDEVITAVEDRLQIGTFGEEESREIEVVPGAESRYRVNSLLGVLMGYTYFSDKDDWVQYPVEGYLFSATNRLFYYKTSVGYFPVEYVYVDEDDLLYDYKLVEKNGETYYYNSYYNKILDTSRYDEWTHVQIDEYVLIPSAHEEDLGWEHTRYSTLYISNELPAQEEIWTDAYSTAGDEIFCPAPEYTDYYQVKVSCAEEAGNSLYVQNNELCKILEAFEDSSVWMILSSVVVIILSLVVMVLSAKNKKDQMNFMEKLPVFLYSGAIGLLACGGVALVIAMGEWMIMQDIGSIKDMIALGIPTLVLVAWLVSNWFQNIVTRIKCKSFWKTSEFYYVYVFIKRSWRFITAPFRAVGNACRKFFHMMGENIPLLWGGMALFVALSFLDFFLCINGWWYEAAYLLLYMFVKVLEAAILLLVLYQMHQLQEGSKRVASGDMSNPIDTSKMIWKFREHGENINKVSDGIAVAVNERMKSERFKTELITNVSHDIKTPLTSIINYVDLIKKENLQDEKVQEYVEVLDRQSARLKKLIEDLMEASKASTGNITVNLEECDAAVLLTQLVGEFEEKLEKNQLEVVVDKPEHPVKMMVDGRHMWRVFDNLLNNTCKYSLPGTRVYISLKQENKETVITFKNISKTALNIPSEELMERFVRGDSSRNTEGSGLGLSIAQSLTELMNGKMFLEIDGDLFKVTLRFPVM